MQNLKKLKELRQQIAELQFQEKAIITAIQAEVETHGPLEAVGLRAYMKPGRKSTDHEAAAKAANVDSTLIEKYSTVKTTIQWAKVTKEANIDVRPFTTAAEPQFVIEDVK